ncbi:hypothetical protein AALP_AA4G044000 [Arabis alpina]|uniref:Kri1-like C-terminal domain-containing protein n=1 Tax=Arabis alpina TaxID=50452 RepID=A0A087H139_ARAAL|nr:hypothetical protein AALP_AA4G044000 [Arabis alpina]
MPPKLFADDDDNEAVTSFEIDDNYGNRLLHNREREDLQRLGELKKRGQISDEEEESEESSSESEAEDSKKELKFFETLVKVKKQDPVIRNKDVKFFDDDDKKEKKEKEKKKKEKVYLKDVKGYLEEEEEDLEKKKVKSYFEEQEELRKAVFDAVETAGDGDGDEELFRVKESNGDEEEEDEELAKKMEEYFGNGGEVVDEKDKFLFEYFRKRMWKEDDKKGKNVVIDEAELEELEDDEEAVELAEEYELKYRHEENVGEIVMGQSRVVEGSVRKKDTARKAQRKNKEERMKMVEIERKEELKQLKNVKKKEIKEKIEKVLLVAGFKKGHECALDGKDFDDEFDPEEYDKMMKSVFNDKYYGEEDSGLSSDEDGEKPDFDKEDELLGLPKDWEVIQGGDGFETAREMASKHKEIIADAGDEEMEEEEEEVEEEQVEGKRKRKRKPSLVQRANEALMEEYYKLDYEDTIGDLKTRFKYAKVVPNKFDLETEEILGLDDSELNQYVPLKKIAPFREKEWEVNKHKVREQKLKNKELLLQKDEKRSKKKKKHSDVVDVMTTKPASSAPAEEGEEGEASKLSRKAKRRRRQADKKLSSSRMAAYGKTQ